jgi:hypothetical protein
MANVYSVTFSAVAVTAAQDVFELATAADSQLRIHEVRLGQYTDFGDAAAEILSVQIIRAHTTTGSGGAAATPSNLTNPATGFLASGVTAATNNTTVATSGSPLVLIADTFNIASGWWYCPPEDERIHVAKSSRVVVRITIPADSLTMNGTIIFSEIGQGPAA